MESFRGRAEKIIIIIEKKKNEKTSHEAWIVGNREFPPVRVSDVSGQDHRLIDSGGGERVGHVEKETAER